jgi:hypothetical protein
MPRQWRAALVQRIVDPTAKASACGDRTSETGIVVAGLGGDGYDYALCRRPVL